MNTQEAVLRKGSFSLRLDEFDLEEPLDNQAKDKRILWFYVVAGSLSTFAGHGKFRPSEELVPDDGKGRSNGQWNSGHEPMKLCLTHNNFVWSGGCESSSFSTLRSRRDQEAVLICFMGFFWQRVAVHVSRVLWFYLAADFLVTERRSGGARPVQVSCCRQCNLLWMNTS